jgi:hypothetical protein
MKAALVTVLLFAALLYFGSADDVLRESADEILQDTPPGVKSDEMPHPRGYDFMFGEKDSSNRSSTEYDDNMVDYEAELKTKQAEAIRRRQLDGRKQEGINAVRRTIHAASSDTCDWRTRPLSFVKGEVCGSHYKVLGIDRKSKLADKSTIKKRYRQLSLQLHPDKNPAPDADDAFHMLQGAYDCITNDTCKEEYDSRLVAAEELIAQSRQQLKKLVLDKAKIGLNQAHYYVSIAANRVYQAGLTVWEKAGELQVTVFDESYPVGQPLAVMLLLWRGQFLLKLHALSYVIVRLNYELAKARGWL